jgi:DNA-binding transcriptional ArsR family regulator
MSGDTDVARVGALIGDPGRARVLRALADGRELPASVLAAEAGVAPSTASVHLAKLVDGGLVTAERHGRHRYFRLSAPEVARALEALAAIAPPAPVRSLREGTRPTPCARPAPAMTTSRGGSASRSWRA